MDEYSKWGNPRDFQISAFYSGGIDQEVYVSELRILGILFRPAGKKIEKIYARHNTENGDFIPDDVIASRKFKFRCGLIKAINVLSGNNSTITLYLDGYSNISINIGNTEFKFNPELEDGPVAEVYFSGRCTKFGNMEYGRSDEFVTIIFKDQAQMKKFVVATTTTPQASAGHGSSSSRQNHDSDSSWPLIAGVTIGAALID